MEKKMENKVIELKQKPIIAYELVEQKGKEVQELIDSLSLDTIEATEDNLKTIKSTRTNLSKEFKIFEDQRKMVKELIMKPYNDFDEAYKKHISVLFKDADVLLKDKTSTVESKLLDEKVVGISNYFQQLNTHDFISFNDLGLKIIRSKSDTVIKNEIEDYLFDIETSINTIKTLENNDRVLAKFQISKDLNSAISQTNIELQREKEIADRKEAQRVAQEQIEEEARLREAQRQQAQNEVIDAVIEEPVIQDEPIVQKVVQTPQAPKIFKSSFTVFGTQEQFTELKQFMNIKGIRYE